MTTILKGAHDIWTAPNADGEPYKCILLLLVFIAVHFAVQLCSWVPLYAGGTLLQYTLQGRALLMRVVIRTSGTSRLCPHCTRALLANISNQDEDSC